MSHGLETPPPLASRTAGPIAASGPSSSHAVMAACALVATAYFLGATWLSGQFIGVPAGAWMVLFVWLTTLALRSGGATTPLIDQRPSWADAGVVVPTRPAHVTTASAADPTPAAQDDGVPPRTERATDEAAARAAPSDAPAEAPRTSRRAASERRRVASAPRLSATWRDGSLSALVREGVGRVATSLAGRAAGEHWLAVAAAGLLDGDSAPVRPLRIGVAVERDLADWVMGDRGDPSWMMIEPTACAAALADEHRLDAVVVRDGPDSLGVVTPERPGLEAAWFDWACERPVSYLSLFPMRVDCARLSLSGLAKPDRWAGERGEFLRTLIVTAATLSRWPARLTSLDRVLGRRPAAGDRADRFDVASGSLYTLGRSLETLADRRGAGARAAGRALSAWLATFAGPIDEDDRARFAEAAADAAGEEPEVMLRLAAVRLACFQDELGLDALLRADRMLRGRTALPGVDHVKFLQSELSHGTPDPLTFGRVAAGLCLACSTTAADRIAYLRDDLFEDMRFSGWLVGRDQDRALLMEVFRALERARRADTFGLPSSRAA